MYICCEAIEIDEELKLVSFGDDECDNKSNK